MPGSKKILVRKTAKKKTARKKTARKKTARKKTARKKTARKKTARKKTARKKTAKKPFYSPTFIPKRDFIRKFKVILIVGPKLNAQFKAIFKSDKPPSPAQIKKVNLTMQRLNSLCMDARMILVGSKGVLGETEEMLRHNVHAQIIYATKYHNYARFKFPDCGIMSLDELESTRNRIRRGQ